MQPQNWNEGVRFHTLYGATEWTALYYNDNTNGGGAVRLSSGRRSRTCGTISISTFRKLAVTVDRPLPAPASIAEYFPAVFRGEMLYRIMHRSKATGFKT